VNKKICLFCGANPGNSKHIIQQVEELCDQLMANGFDLVYGGGKNGLMGIVANRFLANKRQVTGVRPEKLIKDEDAHDELAELIVVKDMYERKAKMVELSDAFIALPGGVGTLDEIIETFALFKIGYMGKPSGILNTDHYYDGLITLLESMVANGFLQDSVRQKLVIASSPSALLAGLNIIST
jgi:uncharacterized protein (TIGR00730 family)